MATGGTIALALACRLTCAFALCLEREFPLGGFAHVVAGRWAAVLRSWRAAGAGLAGFRRTGRAGQGRADVPEPAADPGRGEPPGGAGRSQGRRRSSVSGRARRSWAWTVMIS